MSIKNKKMLSLALSICIMGALVIMACTPQERPDPDTTNYGTRYDISENGNYGFGNTRDITRYGNEYGDNGYNTGYNNQGPYTTTDPDRLYGFFGDDTYNGYLGNMYGGRNITMDRYNGVNNNAEIEQACETLPEVDDCTVVKNGDTCYVGVDSADGENIENVAALRTQIASKCKSVDPSIKRVYVTTDDDRISKLKNYAKDINMGQPVKNFLDDIEDLFR